MSTCGYTFINSSKISNLTETTGISEPEDVYKRSYYLIAGVISVFITLQLLLLLISIYKVSCSKNNNDSIIQHTIKSRILYILQYIFLILATVNDLLRAVIYPRFSHTDLIWCEIYAFVASGVGLLYYLVYLCQILMRLQTSMQNCYLQISKRQAVFLYGLAFIPTSCSMVVVLYLNLNESVCLREWRPSDFWNLRYCAVESDIPSHIAFGFTLVWILVMNTIICIIFAVKLNKVFYDHPENEDLKFQTKSIIVKNTILSITGMITTLVCWTYFYFGTKGMDGWALLYLDGLINCIVIGLMYGYITDRLYKRLCSCCIKLCFLNFDKSKEKIDIEALKKCICRVRG